MNKIVTLSNGMKFVRIPAGKFIMGSNDIMSAKPKHVVDIPYDFWMARYPTTNQQYNPLAVEKENHPVVRTSWYNAMEFCRSLTQEIRNNQLCILNDENLQLSLKKQIFKIRLPTEAEWEKAARGTDGRRYPWGNEFDTRKCNSKENGNDCTTPVGIYSPQGDSYYGCADMCGNVCEWTHSIGEFAYNAITYPYDPKDGREREVEKDELVGDKGVAIRNAERIQRGGSYNDEFDRIQCAFRNWLNPYRHYPTDGFRVAIAPTN